MCVCACLLDSLFVFHKLHCFFFAGKIQKQMGLRMIQVIFTEYIFGTGGEKSLLLEEIKPLLQWSFSSLLEENHITQLQTCVFSYERIYFKATLHVISLLLKSSCGCSFTPSFSRDNFRLLPKRARVLWYVLLASVALVIVSWWCELTSWLVWKKLLCQVCHHVSKLNGLTLTAQSLAPVQESGWDFLGSQGEFLLFHFSLQLLCTRSKLQLQKFCLNVCINCSPKCSQSSKLIISQHTSSWYLKHFFKPLVILCICFKPTDCPF